MLSKHTATFVDVSALYHHLGITDDEIRTVDHVGFNSVSYGDADITLVGNVFALECIWEGLQWHHQREGTSSPDTRETFIRKYWELVGPDDYINLEG